MRNICISKTTHHMCYRINLPRADLELAAHVDRFDFAMPVAREGEHLVIR